MNTLGCLGRSSDETDVQNMDMDEALAFFADHAKIARVLETLQDVGLGYLKLGQIALTLSGGEAQRVKLAKELCRPDTGRTVYILDKPTTGLHFADIQKLLDVLHRLTDAGNTVIIIEHNLDVIKTADWIVDLGPERRRLLGVAQESGPREYALVSLALGAGLRVSELVKVRLADSSQSDGWNPSRDTG